jgi:bifunctional NMN adenylyltransferase/nudix hydrolase
MKIGIFVGRFQTPNLHNGYKYMLSELQISYDYYGLIVGSSIEPNERNPLDFETRKSMLEEYVYKKPLFILELVDFNDNDKWTKELDRIINDSIAKLDIKIDKDNIYLIGSRDSFIPYYNGEFKTHQLEQYGKYNSTELRTGIKFNLLSFNFILGFAYKWIEKNFGFRFEWLKPVNGYNPNWSNGYIYYSKK